MKTDRSTLLTKLIGGTPALLGTLAMASLPFTGSLARAADSADKSMEARMAALEKELESTKRESRTQIEALQRELGLVEGDAKGKNVADPVDASTFLRAEGKHVQQLTVSGDLRFRYDWDNEDFQYPGGGNELQRSRYLFRLRLNLNYTLADQFFAAVGVSTNGQADSQNQPITEGFDDYGIYLHQFLLGWKATPWATLIVGKLFAPYYDNEDAIVDYGDITPVGVTEKFNFAVSPRLNVAVNLGQYIFYDNPESGYAVTPRAWRPRTRPAS